MALYAVSGARIYIGPVKEPTSTDFVSGDFTATSPDQWILVDGWVTAGTHGDAAAVITTALINRGRDIKQKGTNNAGSMRNQFAVISADPGQAAALVAQATASNYAWKVAFQDVTHYFSALVMSVQEVGGGANTVRLLDITLEINSNIVSV